MTRMLGSPEGRSNVGSAISSHFKGCSPASNTIRATYTGKFAAAVESWVVFASGVQEEAAEEDIQDIFADFGELKNVHLNLDRRTGYVKGYVLIEYGDKAEAEAAIANLNGRQMLEQTLVVDWAFSGGPLRQQGRSRR